MLGYVWSFRMNDTVETDTFYIILIALSSYRNFVNDLPIANNNNINYKRKEWAREMCLL